MIGKNMKAKYYIYWNLHKKCFSVKYKGKVIRHMNDLSASNVQFKVSELGRQRVMTSKRKNVHAYVVADEIENVSQIDQFEVLMDGFAVTYNPYKHASFVDVLWEVGITKASKVLLKTNVFNKPLIIAAI
jgi:hypothetical protein